MQNTVFLRLPEQGNPFSWLQINENGDVQGPFNAEFTDIKDHFPRHNVIILAPAEDVLLTEVDLPKVAKSKLRSAIAYTLEEHLSEDVSSLHFSYGASDKNRELPVAVVNVELMGKWFHTVGGWTLNGTSLQAIIPESLLIPWEENTWTIWVERDPILVRIGKFKSFAVDRESANEMLLLEFNQALIKPEKIVVYSAKNDDVSSLINELPIEIEHKSLEDNPLSIMYQEYKKGSYINMLQGEFTQKREIFSARGLTVTAVSLFAIWFGILILGNTVKYFLLNQYANDLEQRITVVYKELFPKATSVISPRKRVKRLLDSMHSLQAKGGFLSLVEKVAPVVRKQAGILVQSITFEDNKAQLLVDVDDFTLLDQFTQNLRDAGLKVEQSSANKAGDTIQAKIEVEGLL